MRTALRSYSHYMVDEPNTWKPVQDSNGQRTATYVCPNGHNGCIVRHFITFDGVVSPSVVCTGYPAGFRSQGSLAEPCSFHDFIKLEGWKGGP